MLGDRPIGRPKRFDASERDVGIRLVGVIVDGCFDIPLCSFAEEDGLPAHLF
jgi:hypothetical protein